MNSQKIKLEAAAGWCRTYVGPIKLNIKTWHDGLREIYLSKNNKSLAYGEAFIADIDGLTKLVVDGIPNCAKKSEFRKLIKKAVMKFKIGDYHAL